MRKRSTPGSVAAIGPASSDPALLEQMIEVQQAYPVQPEYAFQLQLASMASTPVTDEQMSSLTCPVLIQMGSEDILVPPENSRILARLIPQASRE